MIPDDIPDISSKPPATDRIDPTRAVDQDTHAPDQAKIPFSSYMQESAESGSGKAAGALAPSPYEPAAAAKMQSPTAHSTLEHMQNVQGKLGAVSDHLQFLQDKQAKLRSSDQTLVKNKLGEASTHLRSIAQKTGVPLPSLQVNAQRQNPLARFISMVTDGQSLLDQSMSQVSKIQMNPTQFSSSDFLAIQAKLMKASQCLDYTSTLLGKAVAAIKELYGTQF